MTTRGVAFACAVTLACLGRGEPPRPPGPPPVKGGEGVAARKVRLIIGHRGSSIDRPENTLASLRRAIEAGAGAAEIDVRTSRDGALVCLHDADLSRTTGGKGKVGAKTLEELKRLDAGGWFDAKFKGEQIPTVREALELCKGKIDVMLDLKEAGEPYARKVADAVRRHGEEKRVLLGIREVEHARLLGKLLPHSRQVGLVPTTDSIGDFAAAGVTTIRLWPKWLADPKLVPRLRRQKLGLLLGAGKGTKEEVLPLLRYEPDLLSSDDPARLRATLADLAKSTEAPGDEQ